MRTALSIGAVLLACSSGGERRDAEEPEAPGEREESDGFDQKQQQELSELLGVDVRSEPEAEQQPPAESPSEPPAKKPASP